VEEYPNFQAEGPYTTLQLLKQTIEKATSYGRWPDDSPHQPLEGRPSPGGGVIRHRDNTRGAIPES